MVTGNFNPRMLNSAFVDASEVIVTAAFDAVSVACAVEFDPTGTLPKLSDGGETASCGPLTSLPAPFPDTATLSGEFLALLLIVTKPWASSSSAGMNMTGSDTLDLGPIVSGRGK